MRRVRLRDASDGMLTGLLCLLPPQTTVTMVGHFSSKLSECWVKNMDTGQMLCQEKSQENKPCTCILLTRPSYRGAWTLHVASESQESERTCRVQVAQGSKLNNGESELFLCCPQSLPAGSYWVLISPPPHLLALS